MRLGIFYKQVSLIVVIFGKNGVIIERKIVSIENYSVPVIRFQSGSLALRFCYLWGMEMLMMGLFTMRGLLRHR